MWSALGDYPPNTVDLSGLKNELILTHKANYFKFGTYLLQLFSVEPTKNSSQLLLHSIGTFITLRETQQLFRPVVTSHMFIYY